MKPGDGLGEVERAAYLEGIGLFNQKKFFQAHEAWEEIWRSSHGDRRLFYQGLIQCAVALEHCRRANPRGVVRLHQRYPKKFRKLPPTFLGLDVPSFLAAMEAALGPITSEDLMPEMSQMTNALSQAPTIRLHDQ